MKGNPRTIAIRRARGGPRNACSISRRNRSFGHSLAICKRVLEILRGRRGPRRGRARRAIRKNRLLQNALKRDSSPRSKEQRHSHDSRAALLHVTGFGWHIVESSQDEAHAPLPSSIFPAWRLHV